MANNPALVGPYPPGLALELVLKTAPPEDILAVYGISTDEFIAIAKNPQFRAEVATLAEQAKDEGFSYKMKARAQAESMLSTTWEMVQDVTVPASVRADLIKFTARTAGYDQKDVANLGTSNEKINITINLGDSVRTIDGSVTK